MEFLIILVVLSFLIGTISFALPSKSSREILNEISSSTRGMYISSMLDGNKEIPIRIKNNNIESKEINQTSLLAIPGRNGYEYVENFSDIEFKSEINQINRYQGSRLNSVKAAVYPGSLASMVLKDVEEELKVFGRSKYKSTIFFIS